MYGFFVIMWHKNVSLLKFAAKVRILFKIRKENVKILEKGTKRIAKMSIKCNYRDYLLPREHFLRSYGANFLFPLRVAIFSLRDYNCYPLEAARVTPRRLHVLSPGGCTCHTQEATNVFCISFSFIMQIVRAKKCTKTLKNHKFAILEGEKDSIPFVIFNIFCTFAPANLWPLPE